MAGIIPSTFCKYIYIQCLKKQLYKSIEMFDELSSNPQCSFKSKQHMLYALPGTVHAVPTLVLSPCTGGHSVTAEKTWKRNPVWLHVVQYNGDIRHLKRADSCSLKLWPKKGHSLMVHSNKRLR